MACNVFSIDFGNQGGASNKIGGEPVSKEIGTFLNQTKASHTRCPQVTHIAASKKHLKCVAARCYKWMGLDISEWYTIKSTLILEIQPPIFTVTCLWTETIKILWIRGSDMAKHRQRPSPLFGQLSSEYSWQSDFLSADNVAAPKNWLHHLWDAPDIFLRASYCAEVRANYEESDDERR